MKSEPEKILNQLVVTALTAFILILLLLAALVLRQLWLQHQIVELSVELQDSLADLEEIKVEIQEEILELQADGGGGTEAEREQLGEAVGELNEQLALVEEDLEEVAAALEPVADAVGAGAPDQEEIVGDQVDQVFAIFAILIALTSIVIALLLLRATVVGRELM